MENFKKKFDNFINNQKLEYLVIFTIVCVVFVMLLNVFSDGLKRSDSNLLLSVLGVSIASAVFFISYQDSFINNGKEKRKIKGLVEGLFVSSLFPVIATLVMGTNIDFGSLNKFIAYFLVVLILISLSIFSFCIIDLWLFMLKKLYKSILRK